jgi:uncharacterized protein
MARRKFRRADLKPGEVLCSYCTAKCCRYFALPIDTPTTWADFEHLRWYVMHGRTAIFVDADTWYLLVYGDCENLLPDHRCGIYETRPDICRTYTTDNCEFDNDGCYDKFFESADQIWEYAEAVLPAKKKPKWARPQGPLPQLPILSVTPA